MKGRRLGWRLLIVLAMMVLGFRPQAFGIVVDFEGFADSTPITTDIPGLTFTNATVITAGITLNEFEFPPRSGSNVVLDDGGPIEIVFDQLQASVGGFFTYLVPLTLTAFDNLDNPVGTDSSNFFANLALSGDPGSSPNEFLGLAFAGGIARVTIAGDATGSSFTLDDLTFSPLQVAVPEPGTLFLLGIGLGALGFHRWWAHR